MLKAENKDILKSLDDLGYALLSPEGKNYGQLFAESMDCQVCCIILKTMNSGVYDFYKSEDKTSIAYGSYDDNDLKTIYKDQLLKKYSGGPEAIIFNQDPLFNEFLEKDQKKYQSISINLSVNSLNIGMLSCIVKKTISRDVLKHGIFVASQLIVSHLYSKYSQKRLNDLEIFNKRERDIARTTLDTTGNATILIEEDTTISYANYEFELLSGYEKSEIEDQMCFTDFVAKDDLHRMMEYHRLRRISSSKAPRNYEFTFVDRNEKLKYIYMTIDMIPGTSLSIGSFMNITERKRLESEIIKISEMERQQVGRDLHDGLGPHLLGIKFMMNTLKQLVEKNQIPRIEDVNVAYESLNEAIDHTRRLIKGMRPVIHADDFFYTINDMVVNVEKLFNVKCNLDHSDFTVGENIVATHLYYIAQEAINNAVKHGEADLINVSFIYEDNIMTLEVLDNGIGVPKLLDMTKGMGINIMRYRANILKSVLEINRRPEGGTRVKMIMEKHPAIRGK